MSHATIEDGYTWAKDTVSNIFEHIPVLYEYAEKCSAVAELGVNDMTSTWSFIKGLRFNKNKKKHLVCVDIADKPVVFDSIAELAKKHRITMEFIKGDSGRVEIPKVDMLFIDTTHHYAQLSRELELHHSRVSKYIVMHNTEIDGKHSEIVRMCYYYDVSAIANEFGYDVKEMCMGLQPAIDDFVAAHPEWKVEKQLSNNNGLTILARNAA
jgi:hypothetical protein